MRKKQSVRSGQTKREVVSAALSEFLLGGWIWRSSERENWGPAAARRGGRGHAASERRCTEKAPVSPVQREHVHLSRYELFFGLTYRLVTFFTFISASFFNSPSISSLIIKIYDGQVYYYFPFIKSG